MFDIKEYEAMAMLKLPEEERDRLAARFNALADNFKELGRIDTDGTQPLVTVLNLNNVFREDVAIKSISREEILANAPEKYDGYFQVPGTLE